MLKYASLEEIRAFGYTRMLNIIQSSKDITEQEAREAEENDRDFSPAEHWISELNSRPDHEEAWEMLEQGFEDALLAHEDDLFPEEWILTHEQAVERFEESLDASTEPLIIASLTFYPSQILQQCDPIVYDQELEAYKEDLREDGWRVDD